MARSVRASAELEPRTWPASYAVLSDPGAGPARIATVELHAIPGLLALCAHKPHFAELLGLTTIIVRQERGEVDT